MEAAVEEDTDHQWEGRLVSRIQMIGFAQAAATTFSLLVRVAENAIRRNQPSVLTVATRTVPHSIPEAVVDGIRLTLPIPAQIPTVLPADRWVALTPFHRGRRAFEALRATSVAVADRLDPTAAVRRATVCLALDMVEATEAGAVLPLRLVAVAVTPTTGFARSVATIAMRLERTAENATRHARLLVLAVVAPLKLCRFSLVATGAALIVKITFFVQDPLAGSAKLPNQLTCHERSAIRCAVGVCEG